MDFPQLSDDSASSSEDDIESNIDEISTASPCHSDVILLTNLFGSALI